MCIVEFKILYEVSTFISVENTGTWKVVTEYDATVITGTRHSECPI